MRDLMPEIDVWFAAGERIAVATVIRVTGSAPRPVGASMIVSSAGRTAGSVSGGCVETVVYEELMDVLAGGPPRVLHYGITEDMIWDVGLACGGVIDVFSRRLDPALVDALKGCLEARRPAVLATVIAGDGLGDVRLVTRDGVIFGPPSPALAAAAQKTLAAATEMGRIHTLPSGSDVFLEPYRPAPLLVILGAVHVAIPLTCFARELGFYVVVADPRAKFANRERFPEANEVWVEWPDETFAHLTVDENTYLALLTHDPKIDEPALVAALQTSARYVGAIGSRKTHADRFERMACLGITREQMQRVCSPIGLDLGGRTSAETALSIISEIVAVKNRRSGRSLCTEAIAIHD